MIGLAAERRLLVLSGKATAFVLRTAGQPEAFRRQGLFHPVGQAGTARPPAGHDEAQVTGPGRCSAALRLGRAARSARWTSSRTAGSERQSSFVVCPTTRPRGLPSRASPELVANAFIGDD